MGDQARGDQARGAQDAASPPDAAAEDRLRRWRLVLGGEDDGTGVPLGPDDQRRDRALEELYGPQDRRAGLGTSAPRVARWLGDIRTFFPSTVVQVMQADAMERLGLADLLLEPEMMDVVQPDIGLVTTLLGLGRAIPERSREAARALVASVTRDLERRLASDVRQAVSGAVDRSARSRRPRHGEVDWPATIAANLRHYQPAYRTVVPERLVGYSRRRRHVAKRIVLAVDQSGSMASSIVYASVFASVLASLPATDLRLVAFDTAVVDLTDVAEDPVEVLFGVQLGGGTDIAQAVAYCQQHIDAPTETVFVLISDLYEGGVAGDMIRRIGQLRTAGVTCVALLALSDQGRAGFHAGNAAALAELGVPAFACTPELFGDMMAAAIDGRDIGRWAGEHDLPTAAPTPS